MKNKIGKKTKSHLERGLGGLGVSPGIAFGTAYVRERGAADIPQYRVPKAKLSKEKQRLLMAVELAKKQIQKLGLQASKISGSDGEEIAVLFDAYHSMLEDSRLIRGAKQRIIEDQLNAEAAVQAEVHDIAGRFQSMDDVYIAARVDDIRELGFRIITNLIKSPGKVSQVLPKGSIILAENLTPADMAQINPDDIKAVAAEFGGADGHTAIMARALGIPTVLGAADLLTNVSNGTRLIVDGSRGQVILNPTPETVTRYEHRRSEMRRQVRRLERLRNLDCLTRDGAAVTLQANLELPIEMTLIKQAGAAGIGLLRSEFLFMNRDQPPDEDEQYNSLKQLVQRMDGRPVTIRTLDISSEKPAPDLTAGINEEAMSALGLRGIRLSLIQTHVLEAQFRAILRVARYGNIRILLPMVTTPSEVVRAHEIMQKQAKRLKRRGEKIPEKLPLLGVMIEVPGAALGADALARVSDFFAIGSNDLTMYTLAIDRANEHVAHMFNSLHPAVLRLIQCSAEAAFRARIPVSICGEMAGDPRFTALLLGLGLRDLSMAASNILRVKSRVREMDLTAATHRARLIMDQVDAGRITMLVDDFNGLS